MYDLSNHASCHAICEWQEAWLWGWVWDLIKPYYWPRIRSWAPPALINSKLPLLGAWISWRGCTMRLQRLELSACVRLASNIQSQVALARVACGVRPTISYRLSSKCLYPEQPPPISPVTTLNIIPARGLTTWGPCVRLHLSYILASHQPSADPWVFLAVLLILLYSWLWQPW